MPLALARVDVIASGASRRDDETSEGWCRDVSRARLMPALTSSARAVFVNRRIVRARAVSAETSPLVVSHVGENTASSASAASESRGVARGATRGARTTRARRDDGDAVAPASRPGRVKGARETHDMMVRDEE